MKLAVLVEVTPGSSSGTGVALGRLLEGYTASDCVIITSPIGGSARARHADHPVYRLPVDALPRMGRLLLWLQLLRRARRVARVLRQERATQLLVCTGDLLDPPAGMLAAHWAGIPFHFYAFDDYRSQPHGWMGRRLARLLEPAVVRAAAGVIVPNEFERAVYRRRYRVQAAIVRNPHALPASSPVEVPFSSTWERRTLRFTGSVYGVNIDAFRAILPVLDERQWTMDVITAQSPDTLMHAIGNARMRVRQHLSAEAIAMAQRTAAALYLPLGFSRDVRSVVRSASPGKLGEYLASGRPVLAHVPPDSFTAWYLRRHQCGLVVDSNAPEAIAAALARLEDEDGCRGMIAAARARAMEDFAPDVARGSLSAALGLP